MIYIIAIIAALALLFSRTAKADTGYSLKTTVEYNGNKGEVKCMDLSYDNCRYLSVRDVAKVINAFDVKVTENGIEITTGAPFTGTESPEAFEKYERLRPMLVPMTVNGKSARYFALKTDEDAYFLPHDIAFILGWNVTLENGVYVYDSSRELEVDLKALEEDGYFYDVNTALCGDADTGEIYFAYNEKAAFPIASTTKLMTWLVVTESGVKPDDIVTVSHEAYLLSQGDDATTPMTDGMKVTADELLRALLLPSSNESACALACHVAGSEAEFVKMMNAKAASLGMTTARYYNSHGCPVFTEKAIASKTQNRMCSADMFKLASYIVTKHPEVFKITSLKSSHLDALNLDVNNTNGMLHNMPEIKGLKTGTTNKAGCCLVTCLEVKGHNLITVLFGAENSADRVRVSHLLAHYAKQARLGK